jgi:hypothetical protein
MKIIENPANFLVDSGLLFEINRRILHPLGLALCVTTSEEEIPNEGPSSTFSILDAREDPEGWCFEDDTYLEGKAKLDAFLECQQFQEKMMARRVSLGYVIQSIPPNPLTPYGT